jgi:hypothetical protein
VHSTGGLGINHFDRNGACSGRVNWQIAVPNGDYTGKYIQHCHSTVLRSWASRS